MYNSYIITCSPYPKNGSYLLQFSLHATSKEEVIAYCEREGIYYKTIVSIGDYRKMQKYGLPLHELNKN